MNEEKRPKFVMKKWADRRIKIGKSLSRLADFCVSNHKLIR